MTQVGELERPLVAIDHLAQRADEALDALRHLVVGAAHVLAFLNRLVPILAGIDARVETLSLSARGSWRAKLDSGAELQLGRGTDDEVAQRVERFVGTLRQVVDRYQRPLEYADLRHHDGYAVRLKGVTTTLDATDKKSARK